MVSINLNLSTNLFAFENNNTKLKTNQNNSNLSPAPFNDTGIKLDYNNIRKQGKTRASIENEIILQDSIVKVYFANDIINVDVFHGSDEGPIVITIYNMLAKPVLIVYQGVPIGGTEKSYIYQKEASTIPNGHYFCILDRNNKRVTEKFIISR